MNDIIFALHGRIDSDMEHAQELSAKSESLKKDTEELQKNLEVVVEEVQYTAQTTNSRTFDFVARQRLRAAHEYYHRLSALVQHISEEIKETEKYLKKLKIHTGMFQVMIRYQYSILTSHGMMDTFSDNIKLIIKLIHDCAERLAKLEKSYEAAETLFMRCLEMCNEIMNEVHAAKAEHLEILLAAAAEVAALESQKENEQVEIKQVRK